MGKVNQKSTKVMPWNKQTLKARTWQSQACRSPVQLSAWWVDSYWNIGGWDRRWSKAPWVPLLGAAVMFNNAETFQIKWIVVWWIHGFHTFFLNFVKVKFGLIITTTYLTWGYKALYSQTVPSQSPVWSQDRGPETGPTSKMYRL